MPPPLHGVQRLGLPDPEAMEAVWKGLWVETPEGAVSQVYDLFKGHWLEVLGLLEDTRVGCRVPSGRARVDEDRDEEEVPGSEGEEGGPGPP